MPDGREFDNAAPVRQSFRLRRILDQLRPLIAADTRNPGGDEARLAERLVESLQPLKPDGLLRKELPTGAGRGAYLFAWWGKPRLLLNAHLDTVPASEGWSGDPLALRLLEDRAMGLGTADTKGAIAAILTALEEAPPRDCAVLFSGDEEGDSACMEGFLRDLPAEAASLRQAIVCEPTGCRVGTRHRGILSGEVEVRGEGGHSSRADGLSAPIWEVSRIAAALGEWGLEQRAHGPDGFPGLCFNLAEVRGGVAYNVVPSRAALVFSLRPPPGAPLDSLKKEIETRIRTASPDAAILWRLAQPPLSTEQLQSFTSFLGAACAKPIDLGFWTEAALLERAGISAVVFGPGNVEQAHLADEWVLYSQLERAAETFVQSLQSL